MHKTLQDYQSQFDAIELKNLSFETWLFLEWLQDNNIQNFYDEAKNECAQKEPKVMQESLNTGFQNLVQYLKENQA